MAQPSNTVEAYASGQLREITAVTRRDIFDFLREETGPWWGRLGEPAFLEQLYDLDALPSTDARHATAAEDIVRHRVANFDWEDDWVFDDPRFQLADGPDQMLLDFLALMAHPLVQPDTEQAMKFIARLNRLLAPDGWELRTDGFISGRPVYAAASTAGGLGRMIRLKIEDDDAGKLDLVLGQACCVLGDSDDTLAQGLVMRATLTLRRDGGYFHPVPGDNWTDASYEAVLTVDAGLAAEYSAEVTSRIWRVLSTVLSHHGREDVLSLVIEQASPPDARHRSGLARASSPNYQASSQQPGEARAHGGRLSLRGRPSVLQPRRGCGLPDPEGHSARFPAPQHLRRAATAQR
jgi:hypothetical protein